MGSGFISAVGVSEKGWLVEGITNYVPLVGGGVAMVGHGLAGNWNRAAYAGIKGVSTGIEAGFGAVGSLGGPVGAVAASAVGAAVSSGLEGVVKDAVGDHISADLSDGDWGDVGEAAAWGAAGGVVGELGGAGFKFAKGKFRGGVVSGIDDASTAAARAMADAPRGGPEFFTPEGQFQNYLDNSDKLAPLFKNYDPSGLGLDKSDFSRGLAAGGIDNSPWSIKLARGRDLTLAERAAHGVRSAVATEIGESLTSRARTVGQGLVEDNVQGAITGDTPTNPDLGLMTAGALTPYQPMYGSAVADRLGLPSVGESASVDVTPGEWDSYGSDGSVYWDNPAYQLPPAVRNIPDEFDDGFAAIGVPDTGADDVYPTYDLGNAQPQIDDSIHTRFEPLESLSDEPTDLAEQTLEPDEATEWEDRQESLEEADEWVDDLFEGLD